MKKVLMNVMPKIRSYLGDAFCFSIISDMAFNSGWVYDKYVHLEFTASDGQIKYADYGYYDFVPDQGVFIKSFIEYPYEYCTQEIIVNQVLKMIDNNEYCFALWNETIITNYLFDECVDGVYEHGCFIYGYDSERQMVYTEGYFDNEKWECCIIPYDVFYNAVSYRSGKGEIALIGYKLCRGYEWELDYEKVRKELQAYYEISLTNSDEKRFLDLNAIYGFYSSLIPGQRIHYPSLYCIYEHKTLFLKRLEYLNGHNWNIDDSTMELLKKIVTESRKIMLLGLSYNESLEISVFNAMRKKARLMIELEREFLVLLGNSCFHKK